MISFPAAVFGLDVHPTEDLVAAGLVDGSVRLCQYRAAEPKVVHEWQIHKKASRAVIFTQSGQCLVSASSAKALRVVDVSTEQLISTVKQAHGSPVYSLASITPTLFASGDDDGTVKLWDTRTHPSAVMTEEVSQDFISDLVVDVDRGTVLATSGDGKLSVFNFKRRKLKQQSDPNECDLLCAAIVKGGSKVACGTGDGSFHVYSWGEWGDISDRVPVDADSSIDACVAVDDRTLCLGSVSGSVQLVQLFPHRHLGDLGQHDDGQPVERLCISPDKQTVMSCSHDQTVRFWQVSALLGTTSKDSDEESDDDSDDSDSDDDCSARRKRKKSSGKRGLKRAAKRTTNDFFADL